MMIAALALLWLGGPPGCPGCTVVKLGKLPDDAPRVTTRGLPLAGVHRKVNIRYDARRDWITLPGGQGLWRIAIYSRGAAGLRVHFTDFVPGKGEAWVWSGDNIGDQKAGPYTSDGWSGVVYADTIVVEYRTTSDEKVPPFRIPEISHLLPGAPK